MSSGVDRLDVDPWPANVNEASMAPRHHSLVPPTSIEEQRVPMRVLLANLSGVVAQLVAQLIQQQPDMVLVGPVHGDMELLMAVGEGADVVVLGATHTDEPPGICSHLLCEFPFLRILLLKSSGDTATLYWLGLRNQRLKTVTDTSLLTTIRRAYTLNPAT